MVEQNDAIKTKYVKTKIDNMQQKGKCWLSGKKKMKKLIT